MDDNLLLNYERSSADVFQHEAPPAPAAERKSAFSAMGALQQVFFCTYNKKKVKVIVGTVGIQVFDLRRKLIITLHIREMPEVSRARAPSRSPATCAFDCRRRPQTAPERRACVASQWTIGKTVHDVDFGSRNRVRVDHWVRIFTGKITPSLLDRRLTGCKITRPEKTSLWVTTITRTC